MSLVSINWKPNRQDLKKFGLTMLIGFGLIGLVFMFWPWTWPISRNHTAAIGCWVFAVIAGILGLTGTPIALGVYLPWMCISFVMGNIISHVLVALFYYLTITPIGFLMRLAGRDRLSLKKRDCDTYWADHKQSRDKHSYERQF